MKRVRRFRIARAAGVLSVVAMLAGCAVPSEFRRPDAPEVRGYTAEPMPASTASSDTRLGAEQRFVTAAPIMTQWWRALGSARLDQLVDEALLASPTLAAAQSTLRQAGETLAARSGALEYPQAKAEFAAQRQRNNGSALGQSIGERSFSLYGASVGIVYDPDFAGGNRRTLEALAAQVDYRRFQLEAAKLALAGNVAVAAIAQARLVEQIAVTEALAELQREQIEITRTRVSLGAASNDEVVALQTQYEQTRARIPSLRIERERSAHLLAVLVGKEPANFKSPHFTLEDFALPAELPLRVPSDLVRQRPDIRSAEALLHSADAQYGVALAKLYPQITLSAALGSQTLTAAGLFGAGSLVWGVAGQLVQPLFRPGLRAEARAAEAELAAVAANYRDTVLQALRNVADVLQAIEHGAQALSAQAAADAAARELLRSMDDRHRLGAASYIELLIAQQQAQQTRMDLIAMQAQRLADSVAFYQAMGGGLVLANRPSPISTNAPSPRSNHSASSPTRCANASPSPGPATSSAVAQASASMHVPASTVTEATSLWTGAARRPSIVCATRASPT